MKYKIVAVHKADAFGCKKFRPRLIGRTGTWAKRKVWKDGTIEGVKHYECGNFHLDGKPLYIGGKRLYFYAVSTMPVRR